MTKAAPRLAPQQQPASHTLDSFFPLMRRWMERHRSLMKAAAAAAFGSGNNGNIHMCLQHYVHIYALLPCFEVGAAGSDGYVNDSSHAPRDGGEGASRMRERSRGK